MIQLADTTALYDGTVRGEKRQRAGTTIASLALSLARAMGWVTTVRSTKQVFHAEVVLVIGCIPPAHASRKAEILHGTCRPSVNAFINFLCLIQRFEQAVPAGQSRSARVKGPEQSQQASLSKPAGPGTGGKANLLSPLSFPASNVTTSQRTVIPHETLHFRYSDAVRCYMH